MKKNLLYVFALTASVAFFTACSDDDKPIIPPADLNNTFGVDANTELTLKYGDTPLTGKQVKFETTDSKTATITLTDVIPGEAETVINNVQLVEGNGEYTFSGNTGADTRATTSSIEYNGSVKKGVLALNLKVTMAGQWKGTYSVSNVEWGDVDSWKATLTSVKVVQVNSIAASALYFDTQVRVPEYSAEKYPGKTDYIKYISPISSLVNILPVTGRSLGGAMLCQVLQSVTLDTDGNVIADYSPESTEFNMNWSADFITPEVEKELVAGRQWQSSPKNLAFWFEKDGQLYIKLNIPAIIAQAMQDNGTTDLGSLGTVIDTILNGEDAVDIVNGFLKSFLGAELKTETITTLLGWVKNGIPVNASTENGHTYFYLDKKTLEPIIAELPTFIPIVKEKNPMGQGDMIAGLLQSITIGWEYVDKFNIGLDLKNN